MGVGRYRATGDTVRTRPDRRASGVLVAVGLGGAIGAPARYWVSTLIHRSSGTFPWATFWINVSGSFALGVVLILVLGRLPATSYVRPFVATGFLGAYTTYSTFAVESDLLVKDGHTLLALAYAVASLAGGFAAVWAGILLARSVAPSGQGRRAP